MLSNESLPPHDGLMYENLYVRLQSSHQQRGRTECDVLLQSTLSWCSTHGPRPHAVYP